MRLERIQSSLWGDKITNNFCVQGNGDGDDLGMIFAGIWHILSQFIVG
jgi:hypothetical protein